MLAVLQFCSSDNVISNLKRISNLIQRAVKEHNAAFICLPEACDYLVDPSSSTPPKPQTLKDSLFVQNISFLSKQYKVWISLGGIHELRSEDGKMHNSHIIFDETGNIRAVYRKIHLFDAKLEHGYRESVSTEPGDRLVIIRNTPVGTVGLTTCYDMRFPSMYTALRDAGVDVVLVPSAFTPTTGLAGHWHTLLKARAIENQYYIAAAAQAGSHNTTRSSYGHSLIVDPFGKTEVDLGTQPDLIGTCLISSERLKFVRDQMPVSDHEKKTNHIVRIMVEKMSQL